MRGWVEQAPWTAGPLGGLWIDSSGPAPRRPHRPVKHGSQGQGNPVRFLSPQSCAHPQAGPGKQRAPHVGTRHGLCPRNCLCFPHRLLTALCDYCGCPDEALQMGFPAPALQAGSKHGDPQAPSACGRLPSHGVFMGLSPWLGLGPLHV